MLKHTKGNLLDLAEQGQFNVIVQGCNCQNTMASGIAKEIRERYPETYNKDTYWDSVASNPMGSDRIWKLGNYTELTVVAPKTANVFVIVNAYTQFNYLPRGIDHFEYESFKLILRKLSKIYSDKNFGFPYIGMGLAGGDKSRIVPMIEDFAKSLNGGTATLVEFA